MDNIRKNWVKSMLKIADPVIENLSKGQLHEKIPMQFHSERKDYILLEAFGRTINGMAPWLELEGLTGEEKKLQEKYRKKVHACMAYATDPESGDYMNFGEDWGQPLVDAGFLAHAIVRAPKQLYMALDEKVQKNLVLALKKSRKIRPCATNWLFFSAMVETALYKMGIEDYDMNRIDYAMRMFEVWYKGDGVYGDGADFHWDYYNSFVIQPMYVDIVRTLAEAEAEYREKKPVVEKRAARYAEVLERMIAPDGTYPVIGRSVTYRFGAFQMLAQAAQEHLLSNTLLPEQVRCALTAVMEKVMEPEEMFDENGWLLPGVYGNQPELAEHYISIGSLYFCMPFFLPLGLLPADEFWSNGDCPWSSCKIWSGGHVPIDHAV